VKARGRNPKIGEIASVWVHACHVAQWYFLTFFGVFPAQAQFQPKYLNSVHIFYFYFCESPNFLLLLLIVTFL